MIKSLFRQIIDFSFEENAMFLHLLWQTRFMGTISLPLLYLNLVLIFTGECKS
ncbi:MAG: hypothetical protein ACRENG_26440 [bacterium]